MQLYYHKTDGGAEYLCSECVPGTDEGSLHSKYIVRIDGNIKRDAELMVRDAEKVFVLVMFFQLNIEEVKVFKDEAKAEEEFQKYTDVSWDEFLKRLDEDEDSDSILGEDKGGTTIYECEVE